MTADQQLEAARLKAAGPPAVEKSIMLNLDAERQDEELRALDHPPTAQMAAR